MGEEVVEASLGYAGGKLLIDLCIFVGQLLVQFRSYMFMHL